VNRSHGYHRGVERGVLSADFRGHHDGIFRGGVRIEETLLTQWSQFDLDAGVFTPNPDINKTGNGTPKIMHKDVIAVLREMRKPEGLVFERVSQKMFQKAFRKAMLKLGYGSPAWQCSQCRNVDKKTAAPADENSPAIPCAKCKNGIPMQYHYVGPTPHCLRASGVVFYRESGLSDAEIMAITGHSSNKAFLGYSRTRIQSIKEKMDDAEADRKRLKKENQKQHMRVA
jgi:integrase